MLFIISFYFLSFFTKRICKGRELFQGKCLASYSKGQAAVFYRLLHFFVGIIKFRRIFKTVYESFSLWLKEALIRRNISFSSFTFTGGTSYF